VEIARQFVGTTETGENGGAVYRQFMKPYGYGSGTPYCGLFLHRVFLDAGVKHGVRGAALARNWGIPPEAIVAMWGRVLPGKRVQPGDVALYRFDSRGRSPGGPRINHADLVKFWDEDEDEEKFKIIGGNVKSPNGVGEGVYEKTRLKSSAIIVSRIWLLYGY
jgi:hypothetical protein